MKPASRRVALARCCAGAVWLCPLLGLAVPESPSWPVRLGHFQLTPPFRLLSGTLTPLPVIPDENMVDHYKRVFLPLPVP